MTSDAPIICDILVVGGGVAGISCIEEVQTALPESSVVLLTAHDYVKQISHYRKLTRTIEEVEVQEKSVSSLGYNNVTTVIGTLAHLDTSGCKAETTDGRKIIYKKVNICTGGKPKKIADNPLILAIRDLESINTLQNKVATARRIIVVGNGGIALEFVYTAKNCEVIWVIKDDAIGNIFLDKAAADFLLQSIKKNQKAKEKDSHADEVIFSSVSKRQRYDIENCRPSSENKQDETSGASLGPDWKNNIRLQGANIDSSKASFHIEYSCEVTNIYEAKQGELPDESDVFCDEKKEELYPIFVELSNGKVYGADFVLSATGVVPNINFHVSPSKLELGPDDGILVDLNMRTNIEDVYASGDVCSVGWVDNPQWFQMRLWTQARQMGIYSARCIVGDLLGDSVSRDFCFEMFAHMTTFFGYKVCLLGNYNGKRAGQKLNDLELLIRKTDGHEYVKAVCQNHRIIGAILIGETDLEETFENLILNQLDISRFGESLLDPSIDIEDYFD